MVDLHSLITTLGLQDKFLHKIPHNVLGLGCAVVMAGLDINLGLPSSSWCKIPRVVLQTGGGRVS
jgi:hypothetical protein